MVNGRRIKLRYAHAGGQNPPVVVVHGSQTDALPASYQRYLEKIFRRELALHGTPIRIELRSGDNPYAGKRNKLTQRQVQRRRRMMSHIKNQRKKRAIKSAIDEGALKRLSLGIQDRFQFSQALL